MLKNIILVLVALIVVFFVFIAGTAADADPNTHSYCSSGYVKEINGEPVAEPEFVTEHCATVFTNPETGERSEYNVRDTTMSFKEWKKEQDAKFDN